MKSKLSYDEEEKSLAAKSAAFVQYLTRRGYLISQQAINDDAEKRRREMAKKAYHNTELLLESYRDMVWAVESIPDQIASELEMPFATLDAFYSGVNRKNARDVLLARLNLQDGNRAATNLKPKIPQPQAIDCPITDLDTRHETYTALLSRLSLASDHRQNLPNRGLTDEMIQCLGYRTTPMVGTTILAKQLLSEGFYLSGVPGFYHNDEGQWTFTYKASWP